MRRIAPALAVKMSDLLPVIDNPAGQSAERGEFVDQPDELAILRFWRQLTPAARLLFLAAFRDDTLQSLEVTNLDDVISDQKTPSR